MPSVFTLSDSMQETKESNTHNAEGDLDDWGGVEAVIDDPEEQRVLFAALDSFFQYSKVAHYNTTHLRRQSFYALPESHWQLLAAPPFSYLDTLNSVDDAIDENANLANAILFQGLESFGYPVGVQNIKDSEPWRGTATASDLDKARSTLRQFYRDWSEEGAPERAASLDPIIEDLRTERLSFKKSNMNVLVPGAGLARLVFELCRDGFHVEGNEISYHQLLASSYILNHCPGRHTHIIYPWIHTFSNHIGRTAHLQSVRIPDVHPATELQRERSLLQVDDHDVSTISPEPGEMSMSAADFLSLYGDEEHKEAYDAVATVFFLDTAPNPIRYIETIRSCLKQGGIWANIGPLLWHFENNPPGNSGSRRDTDSAASKPDILPRQGIADPGSVELTESEVVALVERFGFRVEKHESGIQAGYVQDPASMLQSLYRVSHWIARKI